MSSEKYYGFGETIHVLPREEPTHGLNLDKLVEHAKEEKKMEEKNLPMVIQTNAIQPANIFNAPMSNDTFEVGMYHLLSEINDVQFSVEQKQELKAQMAKEFVKTKFHLDRKKIDFDYLVGVRMAKQSLKNAENQSIPFDVNGIITSGNPLDKQTKPQTIPEFVDSYITLKGLVKEKNRNAKDGYDLYQRNYTFNRDDKVTKEELRADAEEEFCSSRSNEDVPQSILDKMFKTLLHKIKYVDDLVQEKKIVKVAKYIVPTLNGYYDIEKDIFTKKEEIEGRIFNKTSLPINFLEEDVEAEKLNKVLKSSFGNNEVIVTVIYECIGAMMSGIPIIKKIFVLQGVSNSEKSRLSRIIASCFHEDDVIYIDKLTDLKDEINFDNAMLIIIDELSDKKLNPSQVSKLKKLSNGSKQVKILATTNHPIVTESDGSVDKALYNRLAVIPFKNMMDNSDPEVSAYEDVYLEMERDAFASNSLKAFHKVLARSANISNLQFSAEYPLNGCVETKVLPNAGEEISVNTKRAQEILLEKSQTPPDDNIFNKVVATLYELTDAVNPAITTESIMQTVNDTIGKNAFNDVQSFGKRLRVFYGDKLCSERKFGKMCYNLKYRSVTVTAEMKSVES